MLRKFLLTLAAASTISSASTLQAADQQRPRLRDLGVTIGVFDAGALNAITDVKGVRVGHRTLIEGDRIRTGVTAIVPHAGNLFQDKVPLAACPSGSNST